MGQSFTRLERTQNWLQIRKKSVIAHWLYGILCGVVAVLFFPACLALLLIFDRWERWNDEEAIKNGIAILYTGCADWWDAFFTFCITFTVGVGLDIASLINIRWY